MDFEAIETAARRQVPALAARAIEQRLNADTSDHAGPSLECECGQAARYAGRRIKVVQSILGELKLDRAYLTRSVAGMVTLSWIRLTCMLRQWSRGLSIAIG